MLKIEEEVNFLILGAAEVVSKEMKVDEARKTGAMMLFGEKYPEKVRVVQIGESKELCGGTHLTNASQIGLFKIVSEESVSSGTRRITALTGKKAMEKTLADSVILQQTAALLKSQPEEVHAKVEAMIEQVKRLQKQLKAVTTSGKVDVDDIIAGAQIVGGVKVITGNIPDVEIDALREMIDRIRQKTDSVAVLLAGVQEDKVTLIAGLSKDLVEKKRSAVDWIRAVAPIVGGKGGGGRPDMAQAGGKEPAKIQEALLAAKNWFENQ